MNKEYLNALPEAANRYNVNLEGDEKVVFTAELSTFGTQADRMLGAASKFTLTNKRIIVNNGAGVWTVDIFEDIVNCAKVEYGKWIFKSAYFAVDLNQEIIFDNGKQTMTGFHFYFTKKDTPKFEDIINNLFDK